MTKDESVYKAAQAIARCMAPEDISFVLRVIKEKPTRMLVLLEPAAGELLGEEQFVSFVLECARRADRSDA